MCFLLVEIKDRVKKIYNNLHIIYHIQLTKLDPNTYTFNPLNIKIE